MSAGVGGTTFAEALELLLLTRPFGLEDLLAIARHPARASALVATDASEPGR
jgi:hypothetical protein